MMTAIRTQFWRCWVCSFLYRMSSQPVKEVVEQDIERNLKWDRGADEKPMLYRLKYLLIKRKEFRNVFYARMCDHHFLVALSKVFLNDVGSVEILQRNIGGGFMISHHNAVIHPKSAGENLRLGPGVVIGKNHGKYPVIGNNVYIAANSTVIGGITIGDNVIIGAGSLVNKNVPSNSVYVGNPAHFIKPINDDPALLNEIC